MADAAAAGEMTVGTAVIRGRDALAAAGCETPRLDAELLLAEVLGVGRERLVLDRDLLVPRRALARLRSLIERRAAREPVAYILGRKEFRRITLEVDHRVLIPRPETELLVEVALGLGEGARVADVGTGSGAVALALKSERPDLVVSGLELDPGALEVARGNRARLGLEVDFVAADLLDGRAYDAILANLPYVADGALIAPEIERYEPAHALFAGPDGLDVIRRLVVDVAVRDPLPGLLALEIDPAQAEVVRALVGASGYASVSVRPDLAGRDRVVVGVRS